MITLYSGTPGSYKSYHAVCDILNWLKSNRNVITNFPVDYQRLGIKPSGIYKFCKNTEITPKMLLSFHIENHKLSFKPQTLIVIDEASTFFNPREFGRSDRLEWINFFANHRHFNFEVILITQSDKMLDKQIRGLIEYEIKHRALARANLIMWLLSKVFKGLFITVEIWYPCKMRITSNLHRFKKKKASCYDTMALFIDNPYTEALEEQPKKQDKSKNKKRVRGWSDEQATSNDTQRKQDDKTTINIDCVNYDVDTGITTINNNS